MPQALARGQIASALGVQGTTATQPLACVPVLSAGGIVTAVTTTGSNGQSTTFTEILVPTTATDSAGNVVTGTITEGLTTTSTDNPALITYTTFPPGASVESTSVTHNTHDAQGHPVLGPWPGCWFCPPGSFGWKLFGIGPGVFPHGGHPAGFPNPFPQITIKPNGDPEYDSSSSSECKIATVTDVTSWVEETTSCSEVPSDTPKLDHLPEDRFDTSNLTISERDIPTPGSGDWGQWYKDLETASETYTIVNGDESLGTNTAVKVVVWGNSKQNILVKNLYGCMAIFCVSDRGAFVAHIWQGPTLIDKLEEGLFQSDVIYILEAYLGTDRNPFKYGSQPACYIMGATRVAMVGGNTPANQLTLARSDPAGIFYQNYVDQITNKLYALLPGVYVESFAYFKQPYYDDGKVWGYGKGAATVIRPKNSHSVLAMAQL
ncbi:hypothetical protein VE02_09998 [Pseudogymnoascus sp. 03VT05]|nr:hypothetical protein VE02_09998 [Pseudogymnoascus sp. 03VT05]